MRFVDASVFLYTYLRPRRIVPRDIADKKLAARAIVRRINEGENASTSLTHVSEVSNILEAALPIVEAQGVLRELIHAPSITMLEPKKADYVSAVEMAEDLEVGLNDALAYLVMKESGIQEIYSFDSHFDRFKDIRRIFR